MKRIVASISAVGAVLLLFVATASATSFTSIVVDGTNDFEPDEDVPGTSGSTWYFTWDSSNFYFGANNPDIDDNSPTKWVHLYIDTDPQGAAGTSTGINYNTQQPSLPFNADYHFRWKNDNTYINLQTWNGSSWVDGTQTGINRSRSGQYIEFVVPRANLGSPEAVRVVAGMINEASGVESTFFMAPNTNTPGYDANYTNYFGFPLVAGISPDASCNLDTYPAASKASGFYNSAATWTGSAVPPAGNTNVYVAGGHTVQLNTNTTVKCLTVLPGGTFDGYSLSSVLQVANAGRVQIDGAYARNSETLSFAGAGTLAGTATLNSVALSGNVGFSTGVTIDGALTLNANGAVSGNAPSYGASSTLRYNSGGLYSAGIEWGSGASGPGVPQDVRVSGAGTNVTLSGGATRTVNGSITLDGLTGLIPASPANGLQVKGNWTNNGVFAHGGAPVTFNGTGAQTIGGSSISTFQNLTIAGAGTKTLANHVSIAGGLSVNAGTFDLATFTANRVSPGGTLTVADGARLSLGGTNGFPANYATHTIGSVGSIVEYAGTNQTVSAETYANLVISGSGVKSLAGQVQVNTGLSLNGGLLALGPHDLVVGTAGVIQGTPGATRMVVAHAAGAMCKQFASAGSFTYPIGDASGPGNTAEYSPAALAFSGGTYNSARACVRVTDAKQPNNPSTTNYLTRFWTVTQSGISGFSASTTFTYVDDDIAGSESAIYTGQWNGAAWTVLGPANTGANTIGGAVTSFSDFTGGEAGTLAVTLADFTAAQQGDAVLLTWETNSELDTRGFNLYRGTSPAGPDRRLNDALIPAQSQGNPGGFIYTWEDRTELAYGTTYFYWVEDVSTNGVATRHGPVSATFSAPAAVTLASLQATPALPAVSPALAGLAALAALAGAALGARRR